ncbi:hypothetical protein C0583_04920 [Candidatus Parcubacteria bacterium]|nr:MAG: hypothetical protein C0583_04920 [Candidatus Parcubacteria bacterium]
MKLSDSQLKMLLLGSSLITYDKLNIAEHEAKEKNISLLETLPILGFISSDRLGRIVASELKYNYINLSKEEINKEALSLIPEKVAKHKGILAFGYTDRGIKLGMTDPDDIEAIQLVEKKTQKKVIPFYITRQDLEQTLSKHKGSIEKEFKQLLKKIHDVENNIEEKDRIVIKLVDSLLYLSYQQKVSDIHLEPHEDEVFVRFRIDGVLKDILKMEKSTYELMLARIKILSRIRTDDHLKAQDGKLKFETDIEDIDIRVSVLPITNGEKVVMRILSSQRTKFGLADLGLSEENLKILLKLITNPHGMILVTGPTGSGKTTSIYGVMKLLNKREVNVASIEDPVEYNIDGVNQIQVNEKAGLTFASGLRSILRQDPDIIMIGEIRDEETADIAVNSALTGHLVLSTLHTNNAATTLPRLLDMNIEPFLVASTVNVAIAQRLVRANCVKCRTSYRLTEEEINIIKSEPNIMKIIQEEGFSEELEKIRLYKGVGCDACSHTGFKGRIGIFELLVLDEEIRRLIVNRASSDDLQEAAIKAGMTSMLHDGIIKAFKGTTTLMEVFRVTRE